MLRMSGGVGAALLVAAIAAAAATSSITATMAKIRVDEAISREAERQRVGTWLQERIVY